MIEEELLEKNRFTKEEYEKALKEINDAFYGANFLNNQTRRFDDNLNLLRELVNEHFEEKQETNYEHYKDEIIKDSGLTFALVGGKPCRCISVHCSDCEFHTRYGCSKKMKEWLDSIYEKTTYKLTRFEFDIIQTYRACHESCKFSDFKQLIELKDKGYFQCVDDNTKIHDILANCEVTK